jgi:hypothetical protein
MQPVGSRGPVFRQHLLFIDAHGTYLELDLSLSNVRLAAAAAGNLLCLADLVPDSLVPCQSLFPTFHVSFRTSALKSSNG